MIEAHNLCNFLVYESQKTVNPHEMEISSPNMKMAMPNLH